MNTNEDIISYIEDRGFNKTDEDTWEIRQVEHQSIVINGQQIDRPIEHVITLKYIGEGADVTDESMKRPVYGWDVCGSYDVWVDSVDDFSSMVKLR